MTRSINHPNGLGEDPGASASRVHLLEVDPDIGCFLDAVELASARQLTVPVLSLGGGDQADLRKQLEHQVTLGALVLQGMVLCRSTVGGQLGVRLLGPGDLVSPADTTPPTLVSESDWRAVSGTRVALLGREFLLAVRHWPMLAAGIQLRFAQQSERLAAQLVICQLPRVDERLLALMWSR